MESAQAVCNHHLGGHREDTSLPAARRSLPQCGDSAQGGGVSGIYIEYIPLADLQRWPRNPKRHDLALLVRSVGRFGFVNPVLIDERSGRLVVGHGRLEILQRMKDEGQAPPERIKVEGGEWLIPVIRGIRFNSDQEAEAYLVADNRTTELGGWDDEALAALLQELAEDEELLESTGFDTADLDALLAQINEELTDTRAAVTDGAGDKRASRVDLVYTAGTIGGQGHQEPGTVLTHCCLAVKSGWLYGLQSSSGACATTKHQEAHRPAFIDNDYFHYDHGLHLAVVKHWGPKYATVRDIMTERQCQEAGIAYHPLEQIIDWAWEIAEHAENVIVIPKYDCIAQLPESFMLGYSIPTSHGGTPVPVERFKGRRVHLLGGSPNKQIAYWQAIPDEVESLDNNYILKIAGYGNAWMPDGSTRSLTELGFGLLTNPLFVALVISLGNFAAYFNKCGAEDAQVTEDDTLSVSG